MNAPSLASSEKRSLHFRADIQLIRALAVIAVVAFHLGLPGARAGFLGVDAFFVVSGYLMQRLYRAPEGPIGFYRRRAQRLLPSYFATVLLTLVFAYFISVPSEFGQTSEQAIYAATFLSNVGFWIQNSYFSKSDFNPLLHLWSLGVELQFYLIFPALFIIAKRWRLALPVVILGSLAACLVIVGISPKTSFFMMPLRLWQFGVGMVVAIYAPVLRPRIGALAFVLLAASFLLPFDGVGIGMVPGHPGLLAIWVTGLTAAIIAFGLPANMTTGLPGRIGTGLGNVSYSLYLAHFPVIVLWNYQPLSGTILGDGALLTTLTQLALIAVATATLYLLFERRSRILFTPMRAAALSLVCVAAALLLPKVQSQRFSPGERAIFGASSDRGPYRCGKLFRILNPTAKTCDLSVGPNGHILLVGDSYANAIKESVVAVAGRHGLGVRFTVTNAPLLQGGQEWLATEMTRPEVRGAIFHYTLRNLNAEIADRIAESPVQRKVVLMPAPIYNGSVPEHLYRLSRGQHEGLVPLDPVPGARLVAERGLTVFDLSTALCSDKVCRLADDFDAPFYFDAGHLTRTGARAVEPVIDASILALQPIKP